MYIELGGGPNTRSPPRITVYSVLRVRVSCNRLSLSTHLIVPQDFFTFLRLQILYIYGFFMWVQSIPTSLPRCPSGVSNIFLEPRTTYIPDGRRTSYSPAGLHPRSGTSLNGEDLVSEVPLMKDALSSTFGLRTRTPSLAIFCQKSTPYGRRVGETSGPTLTSIPKLRPESLYRA